MTIQELEHQLKLTNQDFCLHGSKRFSLDNLALSEKLSKEMIAIRRQIKKLKKELKWKKEIQGDSPKN